LKVEEEEENQKMSRLRAAGVCIRDVLDRDKWRSRTRVANLK